MPTKAAHDLRLSERRMYPRTSYSGHIFFATKDRFFEGVLVNFSRYGLFIKIPEPLPLEETLTIALPFKEVRSCKYKGQIVRSSKEGIGVELFRKRKALKELFIG